MTSHETGRVMRVFGLVVCAFAAAPMAAADINLEWRPMSSTWQVGDLVEVGLYAVSDDPEADQLLSAMDVIIAWEPAYLQLVGVACDTCPDWLFSGFQDDPYGLNEVIPPQDGDGLYTAWAQLGTPVAATPEGTLVTWFQFNAVSVIEATPLNILETAGSPLAQTIIYDGTVPGLDVTGTLGGASVEIVCQLCPGDLDGDGDIDLSDLAQLLSNYGATSGTMPWDGDVDCDGDVDLSDLAALLAVYGQTCD